MRYLNRQDWCPAFFLFLSEFRIKEIYRMIMLKKLKGYFSFKGRISRKRYNICILVLALYSGILRASTPYIKGDIIACFVVSIFFILCIPWHWFLLAQGAKRCHDLGHNGWWQMIPFYGLWLLFSRGQKGSNRYGEDPSCLST